MRRKSYPSDINDEQWQLVAPLLPAAKSVNETGRKRSIDLREIVNAIFHLNRSGCAWEMLPHDFPHPQTVYSG